MHCPHSLYVVMQLNRLKVMCKTKPDSISVDEKCSSQGRKKKITDEYNIVIGGNIPLTTLMLHGTQQENMKYVVDMIDDCGLENLIVAPGCDMPYNVPRENAVAVAQAVREIDSVRNMLINYEAPKEEIDISLPDYTNLRKPLIEVFT